MADYDSNMIKPVQSLQNITGLSPAKRREERKHRDQSNQQYRNEEEPAEDKSVEPENENRTENRNGRNKRRIDYCA